MVLYSWVVVKPTDIFCSDVVLTSTHVIYVFSQKNNAFPCKSQFYYINVGYGGSSFARVFTKS